MNKKDNPNDILSKNATIRYTNEDYKLVQQRAINSGKSFADYCREMTINGYVQAVQSSYDINEIREFKKLLLVYKTNFTRIANLIKEHDPRLNSEVSSLVNSLKNIIEKIRL